MEDGIKAMETISILKKRIGMILTFIFTGFIISFIITFFLSTPQYSSTAQLLVNHSQSTEVIQQSDINTNLQLIDTYKDIIKGPVILNDVREELNLEISHDQLSNKINILSESSSQVFSLQVTDDNPYEAATIANTTAEIFQKNIDEIMNVDNVTIISEAIADTNPISPNKLLNLAIGLTIGGMLGVISAIGFELLDNTVKDEKFITEELGWTTLGTIIELSEEELKLEGHESETASRRSRNRV